MDRETRSIHEEGEAAISLQTDAETIQEAANRIVAMEIRRAAIQAGTVTLFDNPDLTVTLTNAQKLALLAQEDALKTQIKTIAAAW